MKISIKFSCDIYFGRPKNCRVYHVRVSNMINDECEMLEPKNLPNVQQAQETRDTRYRDS